MTTAEFSNQFDVLYNNIMSNQAPGLDEYEKSVFLTKAQDEIIKAYFDPKGNKLFEGFDDSERRQIDFSMLIKTANLSPLTSTQDVIALSGYNNVGYFAIPSDILLYLNEVLYVTRDSNSVKLTVIPISYGEFNRVMSKPYARPLKREAWRVINTGAAYSLTYVDYSDMASAIAGCLSDVDARKIYDEINGATITKDGSNRLLVNGTYYITSTGDLTTTASSGATSFSTINLTSYNKTVSSADTCVEVVPGPNDTIGTYTLRYVLRPNPIILSDLSNADVSINGQTTAQTCSLDPIIHEDILQRAVELAKAAYTGDLSSQIALGTNSETEKGMIQTSNR